jgi:hypothetical protein
MPSAHQNRDLAPRVEKEPHEGEKRPARSLTNILASGTNGSHIDNKGSNIGFEGSNIENIGLDVDEVRDSIYVNVHTDA